MDEKDITYYLSFIIPILIGGLVGTVKSLFISDKEMREKGKAVEDALLERICIAFKPVIVCLNTLANEAVHPLNSPQDIWSHLRGDVGRSQDLLLDYVRVERNITGRLTALRRAELLYLISYSLVLAVAALALIGLALAIFLPIGKTLVLQIAAVLLILQVLMAITAKISMGRVLSIGRRVSD